MIALAALCVVMGLAPPVVISMSSRAAAILADPSAAGAAEHVAAVRNLAGGIPQVFVLLLCLAGALALLRRWLLGRGEVRTGLTWDCGYENPGPRMQHTASSFGEPAREMFAMLAPVRRRVAHPAGYFPAQASFSSEIVRPFQERFYAPGFQAVSRGISRLRWLHHGRVQLYVLYIVITLIAMLAWLLSFEEVG